MLLGVDGCDSIVIILHVRARRISYLYKDLNWAQHVIIKSIWLGLLHRLDVGVDVLCASLRCQGSGAFA